ECRLRSHPADPPLPPGAGGRRTATRGRPGISLMSYLLAALWPLFALILGVDLLGRAAFPSNALCPGAERLHYFLLFPALLFSSLARASLDSPHLGRIAGCVALILGVGWGVLVLLRRWRAWPASRFGVLVQGALRFNTYIGLAAVGALFGEAGLSLMAL